MATALAYVGAAVITAWGVSHIMPTPSVVAGLGEASLTNRRILAMEWVAEGFALVFLGVLAAAVTLVEPPPNPVTLAVYRLAAGMLLVMAAWTAMTGARTPIVPIKICPFVKSAVAGILLVASLV